MPTLYLALAAVIGPLLVGGLTYGYERLWVVPAAVEAEHVRSQRECDGKIGEIRAQSAEATLQQFEEATSAALGIGPTPVDRAELQDVCNGDKACRERVKDTRQ